MPITAKHVLKKIRGIPKPEIRRSALEDAFAKQAGEERKQEIVQSQSNIVARRDFDEMMRGLAEIAKQEQARQMVEQERQYKINQKRIKNLKKARKAKIMKKRGAR